MHRDLEQLKHRIPLLEYLQRLNWSGCRTGDREEFVGLCPLHPDTKPSFYVNTGKNLFYCHGCQRGGDLIRFVELSESYGLQKDISAVAAAVDTPWSTGQVEGQINRLKTIKRQMYGRAGFELLRARVLPYSPAASTGQAP